jgi:hypothetical protein
MQPPWIVTDYVVVATSGKGLDRTGRGARGGVQCAALSVIPMNSPVDNLERELESLFARCPELWGFSVREDAQELYVADIGISPRLSP